MAKLRVHSFSISIEGYGAGPNQSLQEPLGVGGEDLHTWIVRTRTFLQMGKKTGTEGETGVDDDFVAGGFSNIGAWIMGRNMFGPVRGPWPDETWRGWWGKNPPYHAPAFVLTHHARASQTMEGDTVFHFATDGIEETLRRAFDAAGGKDVRLLGGAATIRQYLTAGLVDEMHVAISPVLLGSGENLWTGLDLGALGYDCTEHVPGTRATHLVITKRAAK